MHLLDLQMQIKEKSSSHGNHRNCVRRNRFMLGLVGGSVSLLLRQRPETPRTQNTLKDLPVILISLFRRDQSDRVEDTFFRTFSSPDRGYCLFNERRSLDRLLVSNHHAPSFAVTQCG